MGVGDGATDELALPTFLIIGAQKSATRWLRHNLGQHPEIFCARHELSFFNDDRRYALGSDYYRAQFEGWRGEPFRGESTPGYMMWRHDPTTVADRIAETVPDVRLFAVLRNPVDRALSALQHHVRFERLRPSSDLVTFVRTRPAETDRLGVVAGGFYAASLLPFVERFGERLAVVLHDDIRSEPLTVFASAVEHVGATTGFVPEELERVRYSGKEQRSPNAHDTDRVLTGDERSELYELYRADVARLEDMIGRDLSSWDPTRTATISG